MTEASDLLEIAEKEHASWMRAAKRAEKRADRDAADACFSGANTVEQLIAKFRRALRKGTKAMTKGSDVGALSGSREPDPSCTGSGPPGFDPARGARPLREFIGEVDRKLREEQGFLRWAWNTVCARVMVRWRLRLHYWLHPEALTYVSQEVFDMVAGDQRRDSDGSP